jgi:hypothetical protein
LRAAPGALAARRLVPLYTSIFCGHSHHAWPAILSAVVLTRAEASERRRLKKSSSAGGNRQAFSTTDKTG